MRRILRNTPDRHKESGQSNTTDDTILIIQPHASTTTSTSSDVKKTGSLRKKGTCILEQEKTVSSPKSQFGDKRETRSATKKCASLVSNDIQFDSPPPTSSNVDKRSLRNIGRNVRMSAESIKSHHEDSKITRSGTKKCAVLVTGNNVLDSPNTDKSFKNTTISSKIEKKNSTLAMEINGTSKTRKKTVANVCTRQTDSLPGAQNKGSAKMPESLKIEFPPAKTSKPRSEHTDYKQHTATDTPKTPDSQHKRELKNLEDYWSVRDSPDIAQNRNLRSGSKIENKLENKRQLSMTGHTSSTNVRRKITFSDIGENDIQKKLYMDENHPPRKKLRSQINSSELWEGLSHQRATRFVKKPNSDCSASDGSTSNDCNSVHTRNITNENSQITKTNIIAKHQKNVKLSPRISKFKTVDLKCSPRTSRNKNVVAIDQNKSPLFTSHPVSTDLLIVHETENAVCTNFDETVNYSNLDTSLLDNIDKVKIENMCQEEKDASKVRAERTEIKAIDDAESMATVDLPVIDSKEIAGYTALQVKSEQDNVPVFQCSRRCTHISSSPACGANTNGRSNNACSTNPDTMQARSMNKVIVTNPFASYSDTQIYVSILNRQGVTENMQTKMANNYQKGQTFASRSDEDIRNRSTANGQIMSRNDKMVSLLKDIKVISAKMRENANKSLSCATGQKDLKLNNSDSSQLGTNEIITCNTQGDRNKEQQNSTLTVLGNLTDIQDCNSNMEDAVSKDVSDTEFGSVSEIMTSQHQSPDCTDTMTEPDDRLAKAKQSNEELDALSQVSGVSENASTTILLGKIDSILDSGSTIHKRQNAEIACDKIKNETNVSTQGKFLEATISNSDIGADDTHKESCFENVATKNEYSKSGEKTRNIFHDGQDRSTPSLVGRSTESQVDDKVVTSCVTTPKRSARLQEKRVHTPKQDAGFLYTPIRKRSVENNKDSTGMATDVNTPKHHPGTQTPKRKNKNVTAKDATLNCDKSTVKNSTHESASLKISLAKSKRTDKINRKSDTSDDATKTHGHKKNVDTPEKNTCHVSPKSIASGTGSKIKMKIKRTSSGSILAETIVDETTDPVLTAGVSANTIDVTQSNIEPGPENHIKQEKVPDFTDSVQHQNQQEKPGNGIKKSRDSDPDECSVVAKKSPSTETHDKLAVDIHKTFKNYYKKRKYKKKKSSKCKKKAHKKATGSIQSEGNTEISRSLKTKSKFQAKYTKNHKESKRDSAEHMESSLCNNPPRRGPVDQDELLRNHLIGNHACILWSSEHRRHIQQANSDASSSEMEALMREAWEGLGMKEKIRYYQRARDAMKDENKHSTKKSNDRNTKEKALECENAKASTFMKLPTSFQYSQLRKWLRFFHEVSPGDYTVFIEDFKKTLKSEKNSMRQSSECDGEVDLQSRYRKLLFEKISDAKEKFRELYDMKKEKQILMLKHHYHGLVRKLIKGDEIEFLKDMRSDVLSEILTDLRSLENDMTVSVSGTPITSSSYNALLEHLKTSPDDDSSDTDNDDSGTTNQAMDCILSQVSEGNFPVMDANFVESILENSNASPTMTDERILQEQIETEVSDLLVEFFEKEATQAYHRWQSNDPQGCCELRSPSCMLSDLVVTEHLKQLRSPQVQPNQISDILRRSNHFGPISLAAGGFNIISVPHNPRFSFRSGTPKHNSNEDSPCDNDTCRPNRVDTASAQRLRMTNQSLMRASKLMDSQQGGGHSVESSTNMDSNGGSSSEPTMKSLLHGNSPSLIYAKKQTRYDDYIGYPGPGRPANKAYTIGLSSADRKNYNQNSNFFARPLRPEFREKFSISKYNVRSKPAVVRRDLSSAMLQPENKLEDQGSITNNVTKPTPVSARKPNVLRPSYSDMDVRHVDTSTQGNPVISKSKPNLHNSGERLSDIGLFTPVLRSGNTRGPFIYATGRSEDIQMAKRYQQFLNDKKSE